MSPYSQILVESFWSASLVPLGRDATFFAMQAFGNFDMKLPCAIAIAGSVAGQCFNWGVGKYMLSYGHRANLTHNIPRYLHIAHLFNRYGIWLLVFCWLPLGKLLPFIAGFLGARLRIVFLLVLVGQAYYYGRVLLPL